MSFKVPEKYRVPCIGSDYETHEGDLWGWFSIRSNDPSRVTKTDLEVLVSCGMEEYPWEHASVKAVKWINKNKKLLVPTWVEMCYVKSLFWDSEDCVVQYHPPEKDYVHSGSPSGTFVLHLWRPINDKIPMPPKDMI